VQRDFQRDRRTGSHAADHEAGLQLCVKAAEMRRVRIASARLFLPPLSLCFCGCLKIVISITQPTCRTLLSLYRLRFRPVRRLSASRFPLLRLGAFSQVDV
jgi:hypothetical protein